MRFPRTNLTDAGDFPSSETDGEHAGEEAYVPPAAPIWQSNFTLAPNVRFTRTPENLISKRRMAEESISKRRTPTEPVQPDREEVVEQQAIHVEPAAPIMVDVPFDIYLPEAEPSVPDVGHAAKIAEIRTDPEFRASSELSAISDFAFWEVMAFEEAAASAPVVVPPVAVRKIEISPEAIVSRFRVMEWRPGRQLREPIIVPAAAPAAPSPIESSPPEAAPAASPAATAEVREIQPIAPMPTRVHAAAPLAPAPRAVTQKVIPANIDPSGYEFPSRSLLQEPPERFGEIMSQETLEQNAGLLESVLEDFGVKGEIIHVRPGPVVTLYEFEPAPGVKSSRVIGLADDIARSMSALSARVAVVPGRNVIGIELPNAVRETVYFREMIESPDFEKSGYKLALGLGKTIGGEPVIAELAKMPHLLVAGTTGSGKSVAINTMILSLLYRMTPEQCRLIMVDPKMLELSVYDGIPHLLTPVVTDPKKAVMALKWAVREMEERYRKMSRLGVRNIDGYNGRVAQAREKGETIHIMVQTGFDRSTGAPIEEQQEMDLTPMPYIVVIVDEMADLMMVAGKEIEGAIQRLAQMARAAGIHLIMATQRPSVDVITGTIKANFPTRISFQVTSKIDSRTILGEQGAEQLLGQGDMLHMQGGGRVSRVHGPFVSDHEVEKVVAHLKTQGRPEYLETVTADEEEEDEAEDGAVFDKSAMGSEDGDELYQQAVKVVLRDKKCSTSYIQRRLGIGYNRAASLVERMEKEGLVGPANHVGKREIVSGRGDGE
ncbi:DNA translocase FtsK [Rhizobium sp. P32RR-XVIII]|uniref:DNA translocase FtsK n=1 Tax=Rhizobium sp. P32RR-XVIII TaxID=2726738 RepID=UPI0014566B8C|nr:DNA translocase FtsK [Rhizobium sp. P32RR-XVIII]NLS01835.1 DNA translocase FtsK [Rhizobium sp. P32RR-XVIII]